MKAGLILLLSVCTGGRATIVAGDRPRAREFGIKTGILEPGPLNAITDVQGVKIGQVTLIRGKDVRTGVTAVLPHDGNIFQEKVPAAIEVANGVGKLTGSTQVEELGNIETPISLTNTLSVPAAADAVVDYILALPGNENVTSVNPVMGETNDCWLNDIRGRHVRKEDVLEAIRRACGGPVEEGSVGAGTGTICFDYKGGIGTASRKLDSGRGGYTIGVIVQTNFGGLLQIAGIPAGRAAGSSPEPAAGQVKRPGAEGSCMIVLATDAPLDSRNLKRLAKRALLGIPRTGGYYSNGSGDYCIAFSTAASLRIPHQTPEAAQAQTVLRNERMSPLFLAAAEAAEEAILNSLFKATRMEGRDGHVAEPLPLNMPGKPPF
ncbi:MAG: P1 family peptidase [Acidobacteriota bacterium]|nr:P1 family peptidase [Acidobacteriota bacterium]